MWRRTPATGSEGTGDVIELVVGLDFGTSSAKVVVRSPYMGRGFATAVEWPGDSYLLPTAFELVGDGRKRRAEADPASSNRNLKVDLMDRPQGMEARAKAATYLAWVIGASRRYVLEKRPEIFGQHRIRWKVNLGIPSAGYDDCATRDAFLTVGHVAWKLSAQSAPPTVAAARAVLDESSRLEVGAEVDVIPEIVAEVLGYARSPERRDGLHVILDVGATTTDACGFVIHSREEEDQYSLLTAVVERRGVLELHRARWRRITEVECVPRDDVPPVDAGPHAAIPERAVDYAAECSSDCLPALREVDLEHRDAVAAAFLKVLWHLRKRRDPHSPHWKAGLHVFVTGGGRGLRLLGSAREKAEDEFLQRAMDVAGFRYDLSLSSSLRNWAGERPPASVIERLGVAYGLSFPDVGEVHPPRAIEDVDTAPAQRPPGPDYWGGKR